VHRVDLLACSGEWAEPIEPLPSFEARKTVRRSTCVEVDAAAHTAA